MTHAVWPGVESAETVEWLAGSVDGLNVMTYSPGSGYDLAGYADSYTGAGFVAEKLIGGPDTK